MRRLAIALAPLALALVLAGCGGADDPRAALVASCKRQVAEVAKDAGDTPVAESTKAAEESEQLSECAGQPVARAGSDEAADEDSDADADSTDEPKDGDDGETPDSEDPDAAKPDAGKPDESTPEETAPEETAELDPKARDMFTTSCGACHTLSDAEATGAVGPNLDTTSMSADEIATQIENGGGAMPPGLLSGDDAEAVAAYVEAARAG